MSLPTRGGFLTTGLVPVEHASDACAICLDEPMKSPVQMPCKHIFCKDCITQWLQAPAANSCATCRRCLFALDPVGGPAMPDSIRRDQASLALRAGGLASIVDVGTPFSDSAPFSNVDMFDSSIPVDRAQLVRSTARALEVKIRNPIPRVAGTVRFQSDSLGTSLVAMGNLLKHMASQEGRPYPAAGDPWGQVVVAVWRVLASMRGTEVDAMVVPSTVMAALRREFAPYMNSPVGIFFRDEAAGNGPEMLIGLLVEQARYQYLFQGSRSNVVGA